MKIRLCHIANSSTSSFVLIGFDVSQMNYSHDQIHSIQEGKKCACLYGEEGVTPEGIDFVLGYFLGVFSDNSYPESEYFDLEPIIQKVTELKYYCGANTPIKVWTGSMMS